ncbi:MAG: sigma-E processing peptidase SpoIIGA, partial [Clostridia bacterium]|nr:sigma-E processing peptidase SpoIIGA [Clostridia bacterium]
QILLTNFIIDWCILLVVSKCIFSKPCYKHITLSAMFGSVATLIMPCCSNLIFINILKILTSIIMLQLLNIKTKKQLILSSMLMLVLSYIIGGAILSSFGKSSNNGYLISNINLLPVFATTILFTFISSKLISWLKGKIISNSNIYDITLINNSNKISIKSFIDSGNGLYDNNTPVSLINFETFNKLTNISLNQYINNQFSTLNNAHFIEANTIAGKRKILVFTINELHLKRNDIKIYKNITLGVAMHFDNSKEYKAILNSCFCYN